MCSRRFNAGLNVIPEWAYGWSGANRETHAPANGIDAMLARQDHGLSRLSVAMSRVSDGSQRRRLGHISRGGWRKQAGFGDWLGK